MNIFNTSPRRYMTCVDQGENEEFRCRFFEELSGLNPRPVIPKSTLPNNWVHPIGHYKLFEQ